MADVQKYDFGKTVGKGVVGFLIGAGTIVLQILASPEVVGALVKAHPGLAAVSAFIPALALMGLNALKHARDGQKATDAPPEVK